MPDGRRTELVRILDFVRAARSAGNRQAGKGGQINVRGKIAGDGEECWEAFNVAEAVADDNRIEASVCRLDIGQEQCRFGGPEDWLSAKKPLVLERAASIGGH